MENNINQNDLTKGLSHEELERVQDYQRIHNRLRINIEMMFLTTNFVYFFPAKLPYLYDYDVRTLLDCIEAEPREDDLFEVGYDYVWPNNRISFGGKKQEKQPR